jgi:hypothetical protein
MSEPPPSYEAALQYPIPPATYSQTSYLPGVYANTAAPQPIPSQGQRSLFSRPQNSNVTRPKSGEVKLFQDTSERRRYEELAELYAIIKATESLEAAFSRDSISPSEYAEACTRLISQFKSTESALITGSMITSAEAFMRDFDVDCPRAYDRLIRTGVPATVLHVSHDDRGESVVVAETVQVI